MKRSKTRRVARESQTPARRTTRSAAVAGPSNDRGSSDGSTQDAHYAENPPQQQSAGAPAEDIEFEVEAVIDKKFYQGKTYYKLKWKGWEEPTWELAENCSCDDLIKKYEDLVKERSKDEDDDEWEVEKILDKREAPNGKFQYLVKWKNWKGPPQWIHEDKCDMCLNMIAAFENPKLRKLWDFQGSNPRLWTDRTTIIRYMRKYARLNGYRVKLLKFEPDYPSDELPLDLEEGLNIGPLCYRNHWYLVIIMVNYICTTRKIIICDPLNTLIGVANTRIHPVFKRITHVYRNFTVLKAAMTPMDRSDMCAFYVLAGYERALFCLQDNAMFIINNLFFDHARPEFIRTQIAPDTNGEFSVNLPVRGSFLDGPKCEFCDILKDTIDEINIHIKNEHFMRETGRNESRSGPSTFRDGSATPPESRKRRATGPDLQEHAKRTVSRADRRMSN